MDIEYSLQTTSVASSSRSSSSSSSSRSSSSSSSNSSSGGGGRCSRRRSISSSSIFISSTNCRWVAVCICIYIYIYIYASKKKITCLTNAWRDINSFGSLVTGKNEPYVLLWLFGNSYHIWFMECNYLEPQYTFLIAQAMFAFESRNVIKGHSMA